MLGIDPKAVWYFRTALTIGAISSTRFDYPNFITFSALKYGSPHDVSISIIPVIKIGEVEFTNSRNTIDIGESNHIQCTG